MKSIFIRKIVFCLSAGILLTNNVSGNEKLYVFYPSTIDYMSMQNNITGTLSEIRIIVFSRYDDFVSRMQIEPPDGIITKPILIQEQFHDYEVALRGERNGNTKENYVILSADRQFTIKSITSESGIGIVDILGRAGMKSFLKEYFPVEPKLKRVSRIGDLLPFLSLDIVAGIMVENAFLDYFKSTSQLEFTVIPLPEGKNDIVAFAVKKGASAEKTLTGLKRNEKAICDLFYIQQWK